MALLPDLSDFLHDHRPHGPLTADATEPAWKGYLLTVACPCGSTRIDDSCSPGNQPIKH